MKKSEKIYYKLKERIADYPCGARISPVRELMREYSSSQLTIKKALEELRSEKLIYSKTGSGYYKTAPNWNEHPKGKIYLLICSYPSPFQSQVANSFDSYFNHEGYDLTIQYYDWRGRIGRTIFNNEMMDALIILPEDSFLTEGNLNMLKGLDIPVILVDKGFPGNQLDCVVSNNARGGELAAEHFIVNGHRKLLGIQSEPSNDNTTARMKGFNSICNKHGIEADFIHCDTPRGGNSAASAYNAIKSILAGKKTRYTGIFTDTDMGALGVMKACYDLNISIPNDISVIGFNNTPESEFFSPALTTVKQNYREWANTCLKLISKRKETPTAKYKTSVISPCLIQRESVKKI